MPDNEPKLAVIGGTGFNEFQELDALQTSDLDTPYGLSVAATHGHINQVPVLFMPRHGKGHVLPPHKINYRANMWALRHWGVTHVLAVNAVGGIHPQLPPGRLMIPDQIIDYTFEREHTFYDGSECDKSLAGVEHIDFTWPYDPQWRQVLIDAVSGLNIDSFNGGVYGCMQGPRLETAAEIKKLKNDGCDAVGMTSMPEAALARELGLRYASLGVVVNWAAGIGDGPITLDAIYGHLQSSMVNVKAVIEALSHSFPASR